MRLAFEPYHNALHAEIVRLREHFPRVALFDAHSIRSRIPRLFEGELPVFNLGTNSGASCSPALREAVGAALAASGRSSIVDGRFKGGWITRHYGEPSEGVEALQLELACRAYMAEPERPAPDNWPQPIDAARAERHARDDPEGARNSRSKDCASDASALLIAIPDGREAADREFPTDALPALVICRIPGQTCGLPRNDRHSDERPVP